MKWEASVVAGRTLCLLSLEFAFTCRNYCRVRAQGCPRGSQRQRGDVAGRKEEGSVGRSEEAMGEGETQRQVERVAGPRTVLA